MSARTWRGSSSRRLAKRPTSPCAYRPPLSSCCPEGAALGYRSPHPGRAPKHQPPHWQRRHGFREDDRPCPCHRPWWFSPSRVAALLLMGLSTFGRQGWKASTPKPAHIASKHIARSTEGRFRGLESLLARRRGPWHVLPPSSGGIGQKKLSSSAPESAPSPSCS
jgi:hypothetical protein